MKSVGIIGLGIMGQACARQLLSTNFIVCGFEPYAPNAEKAAQEGVAIYSTPAETAAHSDMVIMFVPGPKETEQVITGEKGLIEGLRPGSLLANMSTVDPGINMRMGDILKKKDIHFMDSPVLGGPAGAGHWAFAIGGDKKTIEKAMPVFAALCGDKNRVFHVGALGNGNKLKLLNNMMLGAINSCAAETLAMAKHMGLSQKMLVDVAVAAKGRILSDVYMEVGRRVSEDHYTEPTFTLAMLAKDNQLCLDMAEQYGLSLILGKAVGEINNMAMEQGLGREDHACVWKAISNSWNK